MESLDRMNTSLLMNQIRSDIGSYLEHFSFDFNNKEKTIPSIEKNINSYLYSMQRRINFYDYRVDVQPQFVEPLNWLEEVFGRLYSRDPEIIVDVTIVPSYATQSIRLSFMVK